MQKNCHYFNTSLQYSMKSKVKKDGFKNAKRDIKPLPHKIKEKRKRKKLKKHWINPLKHIQQLMLKALALPMNRLIL